MNEDKLKEAALEIEEAIRNPGAHPEYHYYVMKTHREEWPTLWRAIENLLFAIDDIYTTGDIDE